MRRLTHSKRELDPIKPRPTFSSRSEFWRDLKGAAWRPEAPDRTSPVPERFAHSLPRTPTYRPAAAKRQGLQCHELGGALCAVAQHFTLLKALGAEVPETRGQQAAGVGVIYE